MRLKQGIARSRSGVTDAVAVARLSHSRRCQGGVSTYKGRVLDLGRWRPDAQGGAEAAVLGRVGRQAADGRVGTVARRVQVELLAPLDRRRRVLGRRCQVDVVAKVLHRLHVQLLQRPHLLATTTNQTWAIANEIQRFNTTDYYLVLHIHPLFFIFLLI